MPRLSLLTYSLGAVLLCYGAVMFLFGPCLTAMAETFGVPLERLGLIFTAFSVGLIPAVLCVGWISELVGKKAIVLGSLLIMGVGSAVFAAVSSIPTGASFSVALGVVVFMGIGAGGIEAAANALVADEHRPAPGFALNVTHAGFAAGAVLGPVAAGAVLAARLPWQALFYGGAGGLGVVFLVLLGQRSPTPQGSALSFRAARKLAGSPLMLALLAVLAMYVGAEVGLTAWVSPLAEKVLGSARATAGTAVSVFWVFMLVGRLAVSALAVRFRPAPIVVALAVGSALAGVAVALAPTALWCVVGAGASGLFMSGIFALVATDTAERFPDQTGAAFGLLVAGVGIGALVIPASMGLAADLWNLRAAMLIPSGLMITVAVAYLCLWLGGWVRGRSGRPGAEEGGECGEGA